MDRRSLKRLRVTRFLAVVLIEEKGIWVWFVADVLFASPPKYPLFSCLFALANIYSPSTAFRIRVRSEPFAFFERYLAAVSGGFVVVDILKGGAIGPAAFDDDGEPLGKGPVLQS